MSRQGGSYRLGTLSRALRTNSYTMHDAAASRESRYVRIETERVDACCLTLSVVLIAERTDLNVPLALVRGGWGGRWFPV